MEIENTNDIENLELEEFKEFDIENTKPDDDYEIGYKGFKNNMTCLNKQYKVGEYAFEPKANLCEEGIHYCLSPLHVFNYYSMGKTMCKIVALKVKQNIDNNYKNVFKKVTSTRSCRNTRQALSTPHILNIQLTERTRRLQPSLHLCRLLSVLSALCVASLQCLLPRRCG